MIINNSESLLPYLSTVMIDDNIPTTLTLKRVIKGNKWDVLCNKEKQIYWYTDTKKVSNKMHAVIKAQIHKLGYKYIGELPTQPYYKLITDDDVCFI